MRCRFVLSALVFFVSSIVALQSAAISPVQTASAGQNVNHAVLPVSLAKSIDTRKAKQGDEIVAKTTALGFTGDGTVIPSGTKVSDI